MCGIIGYVGNEQAWPIILEGLQRLEYRGYDGAGICVLTGAGEMLLCKAAGKVSELSPTLGLPWSEGIVGLGHTRWATHGQPSEANTHPHTDCDSQLAVVHNGIVENYMELKRDLSSRGHHFTSDTDTEVIAHLIEEGLTQGESFEASVLNLGTRIKGANAISVVRRTEPDKLLAIRLGNAGGLVVAQHEGEAMLASDLAALTSFASNVTFLDDREMAVLTRDWVKVVDYQGREISKPVEAVSKEAIWTDKGGYPHFMLKEIMEQPQALSSALRGRVDFDKGEVRLEELSISHDEAKNFQRVVLLGCGSSFNACMVGRYLIEELAGIPVDAENSSEFRYRKTPIDERVLVIAVGQSGETADTLAAMVEAKRQGGRLVAVCNGEGSQASRLAEATLYMRSGLEVGVASTKAFVGSLTVLALVATYFGRLRDRLSPAEGRRVVEELARAPNLMGRVLADRSLYMELARRYARFDNFLYLGRGVAYPVAVEGALKLKEISYIHAEGYAAGEMKHGPIALIDEKMPVLAIALRGPLYDKMVGNVKEVKARNGIVIAIATEGDEELAAQVDDILYIPECGPVLTPILAVLPLQLLAYYISVRRGCDVDQPRNLAKSVTVE